MLSKRNTITKNDKIQECTEGQCGSLPGGGHTCSIANIGFLGIQESLHRRQLDNTTITETRELLRFKKIVPDFAERKRRRCWSPPLQRQQASPDPLLHTPNIYASKHLENRSQHKTGNGDMKPGSRASEWHPQGLHATTHGSGPSEECKVQQRTGIGPPTDILQGNITDSSYIEKRYRHNNNMFGDMPADLACPCPRRRTSYSPASPDNRHHRDGFERYTISI
jgi:hypothetical protein